MNEYFISSFQKVATFRIVNGNQKQGGNVASYFCTPKGQVLHAVAGPVDAATFLREARWIVETWKLAQLDGNNNATRLAAFMRKAHFERLRQEHGRGGQNMTAMGTMGVQALIAPGRQRGKNQNMIANLDNQGKVHLLLGNYPLPRIQQIYTLVFERILNEKLSTVPVVQK